MRPEAKLTFDPELIRRYDVTGPRYTSYPTAADFRPLGEPEYRALAIRSDRPLSLYLHIPFCATACYYCACNKIVTKDRSRAVPYVARLVRELELQRDAFACDRPLVQIHWGGGTPTFLSVEQIAELMTAIRSLFRVAGPEELECSIEVDPRAVEPGTMKRLAALGFNRLSMGVQDFDPVVQVAVNRRQTEEQTCGVIDEARTSGFRSIGVDLIYGLPFQSASTFSRTVERTIAIAPDRLSVFNYAHLPERFKTQRRIKAADLPSAEEKLAMLGGTIEQLARSGYTFIGMDHFARDGDEMTRAYLNGTLRRNFQGYSTGPDSDLIAVGVSAIGEIGNAYAQNHHAIEPYERAIDSGHLAITRGVVLDAEDVLRRDVIRSLMCRGRVEYAEIDRVHGVRFAELFAREISSLAEMAGDGLVAIEPDRIRVLPRGRLLTRNVAMVFDARLRAREGARFSRVI
jgi:oxygen-independent coproporphyrinogen III oxidase